MVRTFPKRLKELRIKKGISQRDICKMFKYSYSQYNNWERGRAEPNLKSIIELSNLFNVSIDYLVGKTDNNEVSNFQLEFNKLDGSIQKSIYAMITRINVLK